MSKRRLPLPWLLLLFVLTVTNSAQAIEWDGGGPGDNWLEPLNWQFDMLPGPGDTATIINDTALISDGFFSSIQSLEVGADGVAGGLSMSTGGSSATLEVLGTARVSKLGTLNIGSDNSHLIAADVVNSGDVTIETGAQLTAFLQYQQNTPTASTNLAGGQLNASQLSFLDGELGGRGQINGDVIIGSGMGGAGPSVSPGATIGTLDIMGNLQLQSNATLNIDINTTLFSIRHDQINVSQAATLGGTLNINLTGTGNIDIKNQLPIISAASVTPGEFFNDINFTTSGEGVVVVTFIPQGNQSFAPGVSVHASQKIGDMFNDGFVNAKDARLFAWAIRDVNTYNEEFILSSFSAECDSPSGYCGAAPETLADIDGDLHLTFADVPEFLKLIEDDGGDVAAAWNEIVAVFNEVTVPEPATSWLAIVLLLMTSTIRLRS